MKFCNLYFCNDKSFRFLIFLKRMFYLSFNFAKLFLRWKTIFMFSFIQLFLYSSQLSLLPQLLRLQFQLRCISVQQERMYLQYNACSVAFYVVVVMLSLLRMVVNLIRYCQWINFSCFWVLTYCEKTKKKKKLRQKSYWLKAF